MSVALPIELSVHKRSKELEKANSLSGDPCSTIKLLGEIRTHTKGFSDKLFHLASTEEWGFEPHGLFHPQSV